MDAEAELKEKDVEISYQHPIFTKDPADWIKLINHLVEVSTEDGQTHTGHVYTVDPVSESVILVSQPGISLPTLSLKLLMKPSITGLKVISEGSDTVRQCFDGLFRPATDHLNDETLQKKQQALKSWLEINRLPVTLGGSQGQHLIVAQALTVLPPYSADSCLSNNEIILSRIQGLIRNMPTGEVQDNIDLND